MRVGVDVQLYKILICSSVIISDPTDDEESLATGVMTIVVTSEGKLCSVHKPGSPLCSLCLYYTLKPGFHLVVIVVSIS